MSLFAPRFYKILHEGVDFEAEESFGGTGKGTRAKKYVVVKSPCGKERGAYFKYDNGKKFRQGEECSEKIASEIAKVLGYQTAEIELAESINGEHGLISYLFINPDKNEIHIDMEDYFPDINKESESHLYTIEKLKNRLAEKFPDVDFEDFLRICFFDALVGERDRHIGNWGLTTKNGIHNISPLYDTASCLLRDFQNPKILQKYTKNDEKFNQYINNNKLAIYKESTNENFSPTNSFIDYLLDNYPSFAHREIHNLFKLKDAIIDTIVNKIPKERMTNEHKKYIIKYLKQQRDSFIQKGAKK